MTDTINIRGTTFTKKGGGGRYHLHSDTGLTLSYSMDGLGYYGPLGRSTGMDKAWSASDERKRLCDKMGRPRKFASAEAAYDALIKAKGTQA